MTKQLRLAAAALTDIGRRRERNQDNVTSHVPTEADLLDEKGALFVVCDGMGGHAAGEVASDLGVHTIEDVYFAQRGADVISSIAQAVKSANEEIYATARATVEYSGMGTTCVALVIARGRGYIVNIGDSRAYILRDGEMRQVTQDHSWVAEQVRGGVLSEEQARVHAHRNVITRSLGTQPNITADLFVETLHDGDRVLLCSDGLHGYVEPDAIFEEMKTQTDPDKAVHNLVAMANENGGPDNITAVVVDVLESPEVTEPIPLPPNSTSAIEEGETQPLPVPVGAALTPAAAAAAPAASAAASAAAVAAKADAATTKPKPRPRRSGPGVLVLRALEIVAVALIAFSAWYVGLGPLATQRQADQNTQQAQTRAQTAITTAQGQVPAEALRTLAGARASLLGTFSNPALESSVRAQAQSFLDVPFASAVQAALRRYDAAGNITHLQLTGLVTEAPISCEVPGAAAPLMLSAISALIPYAAPAGKAPLVPNAQVFYALSNGALYEVALPLNAQGAPQAGTPVCQQRALAGVSNILALSPTNGTAVEALVKTAKGYHVDKLDPVAAPGGALPGIKLAPELNVPVKSETPGALLVDGATVYVAFSGGATTSTGVWRFQIPAKSTTPVPAPKVIATPQAPTSLQLAGGVVFLSLADGSLGSIDANNSFQPVSVLAPQPIMATDPSTYTAAMEVPQAPASPTPGASGGAAFGPGSTLVNDPLNPQQLLLADAGSRRIARLQVNGQSVALRAQYVYNTDNAGSTLPTFTSLALGSTSASLQVYAWNGAQLLAFPLAEPAA